MDLELDARPTFEAPWQARAFAVAVALTDESFPWKPFQRRLVEEIDSGSPSGDPEDAYYEQWLRALERLVVEEGLVSTETFTSRTAAFDAGDRDAHEFVDGDPHGHVDGHDHSHDRSH